MSENTLNSAIHALHSRGLLKLDQGEVLSAVINMIFDNFEKVYGSSQKLNVFMESTEPKPNVRITKDSTTVEANVILHIKNPYNAEYDAALITSKLFVEL